MLPRLTASAKICCCYLSPEQVQSGMKSAAAAGDVQEVLGTAGMGHNNPRQKIQYHLRLKQELEEMRHECMRLLRERFHLEQCVR